MKRTMQAASLPADSIEKPETGFQLDIKEPGIVRQTSLMYVPSKVVLPDQPQGSLVPTIIFEVDPDTKPVKRTFIMLPVGKVIESDQQLEYRGSFIYPHGAIYFLFEELDAPASLVDLIKKER